jgi:hypothetical protein
VPKSADYPKIKAAYLKKVLGTLLPQPRVAPGATHTHAVRSLLQRERARGLRGEWAGAMVRAWFSARSLCAVCRAARQAGDIDLTARARVRWGLSAQAAMWHPDKNAHTVELASRKFNEVKIALDILSDETLRRQYDLKQFKNVLGYRSACPPAPRRPPLLALPACPARGGACSAAPLSRCTCSLIAFKCHQG